MEGAGSALSSSRCIASRRRRSGASRGEGGGEEFEDAQASATIAAAKIAGFWHRRRLGAVRRLFRDRQRADQFAAQGDLPGALAIGHEAEVTNAMKAVGQHVQEKTANELVGREAHDLGGAVGAVIFPGKSDVIVLDGDKTAVGDGDAMGLAAEIGEHAVRPAKRLLAIDHPVDAPHGRNVFVKARLVRQSGEITEEAQRAGGEGRAEAVEEYPTEQLRERLHGKEERRPRRDPASSIRRETAAGNDAMNVRMVGERLPPGVKDGEKADAGAQPARIGGKLRHGARRRRKQDGVDHGLVLKGDGGDGRRHGENDVEIGDIEKLGAARDEPFLASGALAFWAMTISARIVGDANGAAILASFDVAAQRGRAASFDCGHDAPLDPTEMSRMGAPKRLAVTTQDVGEFEAGSASSHRRFSRAA